jgi:hypothetical protein
VRDTRGEMPNDYSQVGLSLKKSFTTVSNDSRFERGTVFSALLFNTVKSPCKRLAYKGSATTSLTPQRPCIE